MTNTKQRQQAIKAVCNHIIEHIDEYVPDGVFETFAIEISLDGDCVPSIEVRSNTGFGMFKPADKWA